MKPSSHENDRPHENDKTPGESPGSCVDVMGTRQRELTITILCP